jgi:hypothetical protein
VDRPPPRAKKNLNIFFLKKKKWVWPLGVADPPPPSTPKGHGGGFCHPQWLVWGGRSHPNGPWGWIGHPQGPNPFFLKKKNNLALGGGRSTPQGPRGGFGHPRPAVWGGRSHPCAIMGWPATPYIFLSFFIFIFILYFYFDLNLFLNKNNDK